jgi:hypothetical protein
VSSELGRFCLCIVEGCRQLPIRGMTVHSTARYTHADPLYHKLHNHALKSCFALLYALQRCSAITSLTWKRTKAKSDDGGGSAPTRILSIFILL